MEVAILEGFPVRVQSEVFCQQAKQNRLPIIIGLLQQLINSFRFPFNRSSRSCQFFKIGNID
jgi:hypothetical protein